MKRFNPRPKRAPYAMTEPVLQFFAFTPAVWTSITDPAQGIGLARRRLAALRWMRDNNITHRRQLRKL